MEGADNKTLRSLPLALHFEQGPKAQNVNRMASRLERQGEMRREVHSAANGTKTRLTASEDYNSDPPFRNNLFPHS